ncbi:methylcrotonoyl-CoA carboxylase subunit alpha [Verticillium alfalfae VaMs.102]|uniref:Methylcrotonoyl-CoA carboxylase subunit alpha n=1 Tax=Verticillium alfalfae (strain VaMs.102 / ATCC MYA-4576 / FGSC 10136) TaxID=526221 RepID=C9S9Y4_VERA1|nr:methylcrotonoyl-CoA carboxylase subunit alpha [Verticillium alfalfae VaMs.102]EEY16197.1 methylcrotonoyl-CoA carboxylase subunit alpha [Verticillium alfalfae VaMs.102]
MRSMKAKHRLARPLPRLLSTAATGISASAAPQITPITSLLIANRGEIALRIHKTADRLGIRTTTLYTDPDASSQHAACSPHSLSLGNPKAYLDGDRIISLAKQHGIQALHPGYGFLSENPAFASRCEKEGIVFVGPPAKAMHDMGDKARSKEIMTAAGVPCVPGYHGADQEEAQLLQHAREVRFPVLLKSVKGGGGKGMRIVLTEDEFPAQLRSARLEAKASFGDGGEVMLVEKYIVRPRHVEVQVFADKHGNCVALGERDCSVQRRHQKILEESPAPCLDEATRLDLWDKARKAASAVDYVGAGTVEFILDRDTGEFYFMEMNTRLQVEHPEEISEAISQRGAAIEARIYAESPEKGFMPDSGKLVHLTTPATDPDVRIDAGFVQGDTVSEAYDGMIAKLIVRGRDRETAIRRLELALRDYEVVGLSTNIEFLKRMCRSPAFIEGDVETGFIEKWKDELFAPRVITDEVFVQAALGSLTAQLASEEPHGGSLGTHTQSRMARLCRVTVSQTSPGMFSATVTRQGAEPVVIEKIACTSSTPKSLATKLTTFFPGERIHSTVVRTTPNATETQDSKVVVFQHGVRTELALLPPKWFEKALGLKEIAASVVAPMPCKVLRNEVAEGEVVKKGAPLVVIESMKMETVIRSPQDGVVKKLAHKEGDICKAGTVLVLFEEEAAANEAS